MARPQKERLIEMPPRMIGFKPFGMPICEIPVVKLYYDEYETLKLVDYVGLDQEEAAGQMNVSRPTLTRIHQSALKKIAQAFVEGAAIEIETGNVKFDKDWYKCKNCFSLFEGETKHKKCKNCKHFGKNELVKINK
jgi:predicted DNA-binding protein (UPF0251 family)